MNSESWGFLSYAYWKSAGVVLSGTLYANTRMCNGILVWS